MPMCSAGSGPPAMSMCPAGSGPPGASHADVSGWSADQLIAFLDKLIEYRCLTPMHKTITRRLAQLYHLYDSKNAEVR